MAGGHIKRAHPLNYYFYTFCIPPFIHIKETFGHQLMNKRNQTFGIQTPYYTGCSSKMYPIFVLFISPVNIEIFQVCLFHIIGNFVFHPKNKIVSHIRMCE